MRLDTTYRAEYNSWRAMRYRCNNPKHDSYRLYGGRGIRICGRWNKFNTFLQDMGTKPTSKHKLERKDVNGNYEPDNCVWATQKEQCRNKRNSLTIGGKSLKQWAEELGISYSTLYYRMKLSKDGWTPRTILNIHRAKTGIRFQGIIFEGRELLKIR